MDDPYAPQPKCLCGHGHYVHELVRSRGQLVRRGCSASLCGCKTYRSPAVPQQVGQCPTCGTPTARFVPSAAVVDWPRPVEDVHLPEEPT